jgi:hypothetical protein
MSDMNFALGHDELGLSEVRAVIGAEEDGSDSGLSRSGNTRIRARATLARDAALGDYPGMLASAATVLDVAEGDNSRLGAWRDRIRALICLHDLVAATNALELLPAAGAGAAAARIYALQAQLAAQGAIGRQ